MIIGLVAAPEIGFSDVRVRFQHLGWAAHQDATILDQIGAIGDIKRSNRILFNE
jgi:hypothetical protein